MSHSVCVALSVYFSVFVWLSVCLNLFVHVSHSVCLTVFVWLSVCLNLFMHVSHSVCLTVFVGFLYVSICLCMSLTLYVSLCLCVFLYVSYSVWLSLFVWLSVCLSLSVSVSVSVQLSWLPILTIRAVPFERHFSFMQTSEQQMFLLLLSQLFVSICASSYALLHFIPCKNLHFYVITYGPFLQTLIIMLFFISLF
jgi:hypothetical protein